YLLMFGASLGFVGGHNTMRMSRAMADARMRGLRLIVVDPVLSPAAAQADEWIPIRPGTDGAFALGIQREWVVEHNRFDQEYLRRYTNATYLIGGDGHYVRN